MTNFEDRMVAVLAGRQGSGVLLTSKLVLTSSHVIKDAQRVEAISPYADKPTSCDVIWAGSESECDAALLRADQDLIDTELADSIPALRWGRLATKKPLPDCQILGFPVVQRYNGSHLECEQLTGTVKAAAGLMRSIYVLDIDHIPPTSVGDKSPWAGLSGAPLFAGPVLIGIVAKDPANRQHGRIEAVPIDRILMNKGLKSDLALLWEHIPRLEDLTSSHPDDSNYEEQYAKAIRARYRRTEIFGLDELTSNDSNWDLDTAYLSLEAEIVEPGRSDISEARTVPATSERRVIDELLAVYPKIVVRGEAGAGKTTLVWWLASHAACGTLNGSLASLNGLIPFVIPMRNLADQEFPSPSDLARITRLPLDEAPSGWTSRVLNAGRAVLLVDGLDEVTQEKREGARRWLSELLSMYPNSRCIATVRPLAVERDWLQAEGFREARLLPMRDAEIRKFVTSWHAAACLEQHARSDPEERAAENGRINELRTDLLRELFRNEALRDLARVPLLCAVICALHRRRRGVLPQTRWELYRAALTMLLGERDSRRSITAPEGITLSFEEHQQLLQRVAIWLVRNNRSQLSSDQALKQISIALEGMPQVREQGSPKAVFTHLLNRSGLLQELSSDSIQFIHRTFQDYLASKEFVENDSLDELVLHADDETWQDVIKMAVGHCNRPDSRRLIQDLLRVGEKYTRARSRRDAFILAAICANSAIYLEQSVRTSVWEKIASLMPPRNHRDAVQFGRLGSSVLGMLPGPEGLDAASAAAVVTTAGEIRGENAMNLIKEYTNHPSAHVRRNIVEVWSEFPIERYATEVLSSMSLNDVNLTLENRQQFDCLQHVSGACNLRCVGAWGEAYLLEKTRSLDVRELIFHENTALHDLTFLHSYPKLHSLWLRGCTNILSLSALAGTRLNFLNLVHAHDQIDVSVLQQLPNLRSLNINTKLPWSDFEQAPPLEQVESLWLGAGMNQRVSLRGINRWTRLQNVRLMGSWPAEELSYLGSLPDLEELETNVLNLESLRNFTFPDLRLLTLRCPKHVSVAPILEAFPALHRLTLQYLRSDGVADFSGVQYRTDLRIHLRGYPERLNVEDDVAGMLRLMGPL
ncbi:serine protease [Streptomyces mirabilis]|uniref:serine protease n=1 Tax=Streptomyces mirabilis TaxID=68239 RepID=UPI00224D7EDA|nr:serine protease [Streptomyces mirabilis]MCX4434524.1 NACHT domain-containing protein [Streptomyces mirabilis]